MFRSSPPTGAFGVGSTTTVQSIFRFSPAFLAAYEQLKREHGGTSALAEAGAAPSAKVGPSSEPAASEGGDDVGLGSRRFYLASVDAMLDFHPQDAARRLGNRPLLLIHGEDADTAAVEDVAAVYNNATGLKRWEIIPGAAHNDLDSGPGLERAIGLACDFFLHHLAK